ncbi:MAG: CBS domain-containing protein [Chitinophagaceae bacterium]|nr:CBS domain-containing protein [Chitinophagaceae bacterium]
MLNKEIISASIPSLHLNDPVSQALDLMADFHVTHLPVVIEDKLAGLVSEDALLNVEDDSIRLSQLQGSFSKTAAHADAFFFEAVQMVNESALTVVPVVAGESEYIGSITATDLLRQLGRTSGVSDTGGIIVLEMEKVSFSFSEISKLVETNDAQITQLNTYPDASSGSFYIILRINKLEISDIIATFQRYEYQVKYYFGEELYENELRSNYDHLMNYLNI